MTSLREFFLFDSTDASLIVGQLGLIALVVEFISPVLQHLSNLLELALPIESLPHYRYLPSSLTELTIFNSINWSFHDDEAIELMNHLPHLISLSVRFEATDTLITNALAPLTSWSSLKRLQVGCDAPIQSSMFNGFSHIGNKISQPTGFLCLTKIFTNGWTG
jgi:hypothetical protein